MSCGAAACLPSSLHAVSPRCQSAQPHPLHLSLGPSALPPPGPALFMNALWLPYRRNRAELEAALAAAAAAPHEQPLQAVFAHTDIVRAGGRLFFRGAWQFRGAVPAHCLASRQVRCAPAIRVPLPAAGRPHE